MNFKKHILAITILSTSLIHAQQNILAKWEVMIPKYSSINKKTEVMFRVKLKPLWFIHSINAKGRNSKNTAIWFRENGDFKIIGELEVIYEIEQRNESTNQLKYILKGEGGFIQIIKILKANPIVKGQINYVLCNRSTYQEIPQVYQFEVPVITRK
jgi:thiol:disulfide interchange protein DsbD